MAGVNYTIH